MSSNKAKEYILAEELIFLIPLCTLELELSKVGSHSGEYILVGDTSKLEDDQLELLISDYKRRKRLRYEV
jgi:hypothetical protein